jgi:transcription elongation factor
MMNNTGTAAGEAPTAANGGIANSYGAYGDYGSTAAYGAYGSTAAYGAYGETPTAGGAYGD